ncbi:MAG TPA: CDP-diacylglycerol--serine O-phosphatidyltransferase [Vicinamibacterales bacterium]|nr:CDP-diacylglycerol--serine O-phosphatidyltransferase [Vicinamibacterales bacterium]
MNPVLAPYRRHTDVPHRRFRRGVYLLPSLMTLGNLFCGYACVIYAMRGEYAVAAPFIGVAMVLDMLDGRIARLTGTASEFGVQFDSLADVISFGIAPAILTFSWGLTSLGNWGWAAGFVYVTAAAMRLARFNIQAGSVDKRYFVGMPSPAAATVPASMIFAYPSGFQEPIGAIPVLALVLVPAFLMVSTIKFRSFKTFDLQTRRSYTVLLLIALVIAFVSAHPALALVTLSYGYMLSAFIELGVLKVRHRNEPVTVSRVESPESRV